MPVFLEILRGPPVFVSTSPEQKLRGMVLDTLHRLPFTPPEALGRRWCGWTAVRLVNDGSCILSH